jgi:alkylhydroperoxidase family enzyme
MAGGVRVRLKGLFVSTMSAAIVAGPGVLAAQTHVDPPGARQPRPLAEARIAPLGDAELSETQRQLVARFFPRGRPDNGFRTLLHVPPLAEGIQPYTTYLSEASTLTPRDRELLVLRVAWLHGNQPIWALHAPRARAAGLTAADVHRIAEGPDAAGWRAFDVTLLRLADELVRNTSVTDATWKALSASYDLHHLMDAVETVNHFVVLSSLYNTFGVRPDEGLTDRLPTDVPFRLAVPPREPPPAVARVEPVQGTAIAISRTLARHPKLNEARSARANFINRVSKLSPRHREMLILRMGWNCQSEYEWAKHVGSVGRARDHGLEPRRIAEGPSSPAWDPFEKAILLAADELYRDGLVSDATWKALSSQFDQTSLMSAVFTASSYQATSMVLNTLGVQLEPGDEGFPDIARQ